MNDFNKILEQYDIKFIDKQTVTIEADIFHALY